MRFAGFISKAVYTHSEYEGLVAYPQQQLLRECVALLLTNTDPIVASKYTHFNNYC